MHYQSIDIDCKVKVVILLGDYRMRIVCGRAWKKSLQGFALHLCIHSHSYILSKLSGTASSCVKQELENAIFLTTRG